MAHDPYKAAKKKVKAKKGFYGHLTAYLSVNTMMLLVTFLDGQGLQWGMVALMWGIGLLSHYFSVFGLPGIGAYGGKEWEDKEIRKELRKQGYELEDYGPEEVPLDLREVRRSSRRVSDDDFV